MYQSKSEPGDCDYEYDDRKCDDYTFDPAARR